jgi:hypothetical protein
MPQHSSYTGLFASHFLEQGTWQQAFLYFAPMVYTTALAFYFDHQRTQAMQTLTATMARAEANVLQKLKP